MGGIRQCVQDGASSPEPLQTVKERILCAVAAKDRIIERQALVMTLATEVVSETAVSRAVNILVDATYQVVNCERVSLFLIDDGALVCHAAPAGGETGWRLPLGKGIAGHVGLTGEALNIPDAYRCKDGLFDRSNDLKTGYRTCSIMCLPLKHHDGSVLGVLQAINKKSCTAGEPLAYVPFDSVDEQMLQFLLALTVQQLRTCDLISAREQAQEQTATVLTLTSAICSNRELSEVVSALADAIQTLVFCQHVLVLLPEKGDWVCRASTSQLKHIIGASLKIDMVVDVAKTGKPVLVDEGGEQKEVLAELETRLHELDDERQQAEDVDTEDSEGEDPEEHDEDEEETELRVASTLCCAIQDKTDSDIVGVVVAVNKLFDWGSLAVEEAPMKATMTQESESEKKSTRRTSSGRVLDPSQARALALGSLLGQAQRDARQAMALPQTAEKEEFGAFEHSDIEKLGVLLGLAGHVVKTASLYDKETRANKKVSVLLMLIQNVQSAIEAKDFSRVCQLISVHALSMFECDRCTFYTVDNFANELIGHFVARVPGEVEEKLQEIRVPMEGIAGEVAKTGDVLNIRDAWSDNRFWKQNDLKTGYRTKTILCAPLCASNGKVVAVIQCINKHNFECFNEDDEKILTQISLLLSDLMQKFLLESSYTAFIETSEKIGDDVKHMYRQFCHDVSDVEEIADEPEKKWLRERKYSVFYPSAGLPLGGLHHRESICNWGFDYLALVADHDRIVPSMEQCFERFKLFSSFSIQVESFRAFVVALRSHYRTDAAYHNWLHAFVTLHATFLMLHSFGLRKVLPAVDVLALLLAAMGHDVDHPGFTNAYQVATESPLAILYNDKSVLEQHHAATTCRLLKTSEPNLLKSMDKQGARRVRQVIMSSVLATDMARHNETILWLESNSGSISMARGGGSEDLGADNYVHLCDSLLHAADLVHPTLPWRVHKHFSMLMATEFFIQYEEEQRRGLPSLPFMGKSPDNLVELAPVQVGFLQFVVAPLWKSLHFAVGGNRAHSVVENIEANSGLWKAMEKGQEFPDDEQPFQDPGSVSSPRASPLPTLVGLPAMPEVDSFRSDS